MLQRPTVPPRTISDSHELSSHARVFLIIFSIAQFHVPIGDIEEVFPTLMRLGGKRNIYKGSPFRALRLAGKLHSRLVRQTISLLRIAGDTGANDIFPSCLSPSIPWKNVIQIQLLARLHAVAILACVFVTLENIVSGELHLFFRQSFKKQENNNPRHPDLHRDRLRHLIFGIATGKIPPTREIVGDEALPSLCSDHLGMTLIEESESPTRTARVYRLPQPVEDQHWCIEKRLHM